MGSLHHSSSLLILTSTFTFFLPLIEAQSSHCRTTCGQIPIKYPFGIDDGCGSPYYRHILVCDSDQILALRTPSGHYPIHQIDYSDPHILISDPNMWNCNDQSNFRKPNRPFSLDTSIHLTLSPQNDYLFFNCSENDVNIEPRPMFCEQHPDQCDSTCDSASYLCRHLPGCGSALHGSGCCSYYPKATESLRLMLKYCASYTSVYWKNVGAMPPYKQVTEYGIRIDFEIPVTTRCLQCEDEAKGGGICGFAVQTQSFLCLCEKGNTTTYCQDHSEHKRSGVVAGTATAVSVAGAIGIGAGIWYLKKVRSKAPVTHGVQTNENRLF
ncbi:hypothetical protein LIER_28617 [Lithospermum erythrorhizon]|uniref:Wall-associated receptor kinase galacturonan-binding domain-containing protein n=1 Tax=Lithospermum erythrorhizon TaxID=34254 RepID=A0AAV3RGB9_LITER